LLRGNKKIIIDAPLLFETKFLEYFCHPIMCVYTDPETQFTRLMSRSATTEEEARSRISSQMSLDTKVKLSQIIINN